MIMENSMIEFIVDNSGVLIIFGGIINLVLIGCFILLVSDVNAIKHIVRDMNKNMQTDATVELANKRYAAVWQHDHTTDNAVTLPADKRAATYDEWKKAHPDSPMDEYYKQLL